MLAAGLAALTVLAALVAYAAWCTARPFTPAGKVRAGRRIWTAWRRIDRAGRR